MAYPTVSVVSPFGALRGLERDGVMAFSGVRYARAERFRPPVPVTDWDGELDATAVGPQCPQLFGMLEQALGGTSLPADEDCLNLNVYTPGCDDRARPVIVWIHGGAFTTGTGAMPWYDGSRLAILGDVVVVTINYRLGAFGFSGRTNAGLRDQVCALQWVRQQIAAFGGDPGNVTIVGESAGGASVVALMAVPSADGLFHRAFAMSPSLGQLRSGERADEALATFLAETGATDLADLADTPVQRLLDAQGEIIRRHAGAGLTDFSPCHDGSFVPEPILDAAARHPAPLVVGTTRDEMLLFTTFNPAMATLDDDGLLALAVERLGERAVEAIDRYGRHRRGAAALAIASAIQTDDVFRVPARRLVEARVASGVASWMYWFTWASPAFHGRLGSCHAMDIPFVFNNLHRRGVAQFTGEGTDRQAVADAYSASLLALATTGEPGWDRYDLDRRTTMVFDVDGVPVHDPEPELRELWS